VTHLNEGLRRIEEGDLGFRLDKTTNDEMGTLADSINRMANSVQESFQRLEEAKTKAEEANRMKSSFLASMSHELRTPLNGVIGFAELLGVELQDRDQRAYAESIHASGRRLLEVVNGILDLARIEGGYLELKPTALEIKRLIAGVAAAHRAAAEGKGLALTESYGDDVPAEIVCDAARLKQLLDHLLDNAVKFTERGSVAIDVSRNAEQLMIVVRDTGPGIAPEDQATVFEKFRQAEDFLTREHGGTGIGLALVKELVALMGGTVTLESTLGQGASFRIALPLG
jgi:hypothetical protein